MPDPAPQADPATEKPDAKRAPPAPEEPWRPKRGAPCSVVLMRGGPQYVEVGGRVVELARDSTDADVEYTTSRGQRVVARMPLIARTRRFSSVGYCAPRA